MTRDNVITRAWRAEPVAIVTVLGTVSIAVLQATTSPGGWSLTTLLIAAIGALMGLVERANVFAPDTIDKLASESSKDDLDADSSVPDVQA